MRIATALTLTFLVLSAPVQRGEASTPLPAPVLVPHPFATSAVSAVSTSSSACSEYECSLHWMGVDYCKGPGESVSTPACTFTCWCGDSGDCLWWTSDC